MGKPADHSQQESALPAGTIAAAAAWAVVVALGGLPIGWLIAQPQVGVYGNLGLLLLGFVAGIVARSITGGPVRWVGWMLVGAMLAAFFFTLVGWLRWHPAAGIDTWIDAIKALPNVGMRTLMLGLMCAGFGAYSAYSRAGADLWKRFVKQD